MSRLFFVTFLLCALSSGASAQQHVFTNKEGIQIVAEIESVNPDWKKMTIRKDGNSFAIEPRVLVLDDQQYVKNWLKERGIERPLTSTGGSAPAESTSSSVDPSSFNINVETKRILVDSDRVKRDTYTRLDTKKYNYEISLTSRGRQPVSATKVSYAIVWKEGVSFPETGGYSTSSSSNKNYAIRGSQNFSQFIYNRTESISTKEVEINSVNYDGDEDYHADKLLGVVVYIELSDGTRITEYRSTDAAGNDLVWANVKDLPLKPGGSSSVSRPSNSSGSERYLIELQKGQSDDRPLFIQGKRITISASVKPDIKSPDGIIAALGGRLVNVILYVQDRRVYASVRQRGETKEIYQSMPLGAFDVVVDVDDKGLHLAVDNGTPVTHSEVTFFGGRMNRGAFVGRDCGESVPGFPENFDFAGEIEGARFLIRE